MIKAIITDFDGTLLNDHGALSPRTISALQAIKQNNLLFVAASGRFYPGIHRIIQPHLSHCVYCCNNGTWIETSDRKQVLSRAVFSDEELVLLLKEAKMITDRYPDLYSFSCDADRAYVEYANGNLIAALLRAHTKTTVLPSLENYRRNISKLSFFCHDGMKKEHIEALQQIGRTHERFQTGSQWFDIQKKGVTKACVFDVLKSNYHIQPEETLVFGDSFNDIEMLSSSPNSYAMSHAPDAVKKSARHLAPANEDDGVAVILESLGICE